MRLQLMLVLSVALLASGARADEGQEPGQGTVISKVEIYADDDDTTVITTLVDGEVALPARAMLGAHALVDVVSTASVDVVAAATRVWRENRYEGGARASLAAGNADLGSQLVASGENDWRSLGVRATAGLPLAQKNARLDAAWGYTANVVGRAGDPSFEDSLVVHAAQFGATQLLDESTLVGAAYSLAVLDGFQSSPYRFVMTGDGRFSVLERHPASRLRHAVIVRLLRALGRRASGEATYRLYGDDWGIISHTLTASVRIELGRAWELRLRARAYTQSAAAFFRESYDRLRRFMSADRELATFWDVGAGPKLFFSSGPFTLDAKLDATYYRFLDFARLEGRLALVASLGLGVDF